MKKIYLLIFLLSIESLAQPVPSHYYKIWQKDSLYYLLTDKGLLKFYSPRTSGEFYLTRFIEGNFTFNMSLMMNEDHLFLYSGAGKFSTTKKLILLK